MSSPGANRIRVVDTGEDNGADEERVREAIVLWELAAFVGDRAGCSPALFDLQYANAVQEGGRGSAVRSLEPSWAKLMCSPSSLVVRIMDQMDRMKERYRGRGSAVNTRVCLLQHIWHDTLLAGNIRRSVSRPDRSTVRGMRREVSTSWRVGPPQPVRNTDRMILYADKEECFTRSVRTTFRSWTRSQTDIDQSLGRFHGARVRPNSLGYNGAEPELVSATARRGG